MVTLVLGYFSLPERDHWRSIGPNRGPRAKPLCVFMPVRQIRSSSAASGTFSSPNASCYVEENMPMPRCCCVSVTGINTRRFRSLGSSGRWIANDREFWQREVRLSKDQCDRCLSRLEDWRLIERRQFWFGRRNVLHVTPTAFTLQVRASIDTWSVAHDLLGSEAFLRVGPDVCDFAELGLAKLLISKEVSAVANPASAKVLNSNKMDNENTYLVEPDWPCSAPPPCPDSGPGTQEANIGKSTSKASPLSGEQLNFNWCTQAA